MARQAETLEINMELAEIPGTSLKVSRVAIGTWAIGGWMWGGTDEAESVSTIRAGLEWNDGKVFRNATRARIMREIDESLRRLRTAYTDLHPSDWPAPLVAFL